jgi:hypothetical protein
MNYYWLRCYFSERNNDYRFRETKKVGKVPLVEKEGYQLAFEIQYQIYEKSEEYHINLLEKFVDFVIDDLKETGGKPNHFVFALGFRKKTFIGISLYLSSCYQLLIKRLREIEFPTLGSLISRIEI